MEQDQNTDSRIVSLYRDLIHLRRNLDGDVPGLLGPRCALFQYDNNNKVIAFHRWNSAAHGQDVVVIANFSTNILTGYNVNFPESGLWWAHFNTDSTNYGTDFGNIGLASVTASPGGRVNLGRYSVLVMSQQQFPPQLNVIQSNGLITISWPATFAAWTLDAASTLNDPLTWTPISPSQFVTNAATISFTTSPSAAAAFYRLRE